MSRWYYTDPLAAAWMAKHFGMRFSGAFADGFFEIEARKSPLCSMGEWFPKGDDFEYYGLYYIHPDSLHLLEPKEGDVVEVASNPSGYFSSYSSGMFDNQPYSERDEFFKIIQRNGLPFMWPEQEKE